LTLKFGIQKDAHLQAWQLGCVKNLELSGLAQLHCVIESTDEISEGKETLLNPFADFLRVLDPPSQRYVPTTVLSPKQPNTDTTAEVCDPQLDFILSFCNKDLALPLVPVSKYGVWYFVHSDIAKFDSPAPCFWEIYYGDDVTGAVLLKLVDDSTAGIPLRSGYFSTDHTSLVKSVETVFDSLPLWPAFVCREINRGTFTSLTASPVADAPKHYGFPTLSQLQVLKKLTHRNKKILDRQNRFCDIDWNIGRLNGDVGSCVAQESCIVPTVSIFCSYSRGQYLADPCLFTKDYRQFVFCELYDYTSNKGTIAVFELKDDRALGLQVVIEEPGHLSYPQVFEYADSIYCMPESADARQVNLYKATDFPSRWEKVHTLLDDIAAVDTTLLSFENKWWLFFTDGEARRFNSHLHIWYASDLFGSWQPHVRNPVKIDVRSALSAGQFFWHENCLYRPTQDCSRTYGGQININKVNKLSEWEFEESRVATIAPPSGKYSQGIHTLSSTEGYSVVDVKRYVFNPSKLIGAFRQTAKNTALKLGVPEETIRRLKQRIG